MSAYQIMILTQIFQIFLIVYTVIHFFRILHHQHGLQQYPETY